MQRLTSILEIANKFKFMLKRRDWQNKIKDKNGGKFNQTKT